MISKPIFIVFIVPVIFSLIFGCAVMIDILQEPGRKLDLWPLSLHDGLSYGFSQTADALGHYDTVTTLQKFINIPASEAFTVK